MTQKINIDLIGVYIYYQNMKLDVTDIQLMLIKGYKCLELPLKHYGNHIGSKQFLTVEDTKDWLHDDGSLQYHFQFKNELTFCNCELFEVNEKLADAFDSRKGADITLVAGGQEIAVSKFILIINSSVFETMFSGDWSEKDGRVVIDDIEYDTMRSLIKSMYTGIVDMCEPVAAVKLFNAADKYAVESVKNHAKNYVVKNISNSTVLHVLQTADLHEDQLMAQAALEFLVSKDCAPITSLSGYETLSSKQISLIVDTLFSNLACRKWLLMRNQVE